MFYASLYMTVLYSALAPVVWLQEGPLVGNKILLQGSSPRT